MISARRACKAANGNLRRIVSDAQRIVDRVLRVASGGKRQSLLKISDEFAAIARAADRAKRRTYDLCMELGREETRRQQKARRP